MSGPAVTELTDPLTRGGRGYGAPRRAADAATEATYVAFMGVAACLAFLTIVLRCCCRCSSSICLLLLLILAWRCKAACSS